MKRKLKRGLALFLSILMLLAMAVPSYAAEGEGIVIQNGRFTATKISNPLHGAGEVDGIQPGGDRDNSYAFSMGDDAENVYLGVNRNFVWSAMMADPNFASYSPFLEEYSLGELPPANWSDSAARLFMIDKQTKEVRLAYKSPLDENGVPYDNSYRGAKANFKSAGSDTESYYFGTTGSKFARILRIDPGYDPAKDEPVEVIRINGRVTIRAMATHENLLTFGVTEADGGVSVYAAADPDGGAGNWARIGSEKDFSAFNTETTDVAFQSYVSNLYSFNGWLYVGFSGSEAEREDSGFLIYKGKYVGEQAAGANDAGWIWEPVVGPDGKYERGLGDCFSSSPAFSPYVDENGKEWVYVSTMSDTFYPLFTALTGDYSELYEAVQHSAELFRFDANDNWEMVMGDPALHLDYFDKPLSGYYNGFSKENDKLNMQSYIWYMVDHNNEIYTGTYNAATWLKYVTIGIDNDKLNDLVHYSDEKRDKAVSEIAGGVVKMLGGELSPWALAAIKSAAAIFFKALQNIDCAQASNNIQAATSAIFNAFNVLISQLDRFLPEGKTAVSLVENSCIGNLYKFVALCDAVASTPRGFSLYKTNGGVQLEQITNDGFQDEYNYGIRNLVSTQEGLFVGTANPYYGCQLWLLTEEGEPAVQPEKPEPSWTNLFRMLASFWSRVCKLLSQPFQR